MSCKRVLLSLFCFVLTLSALPVEAQQTLGAITGTITDSTGAIIQKSEVLLVNNDTGFKKSVVSRDDGSFFFPDLPIGTYTLTFQQTGFRKEVHDHILVQANRTT